jgi:hypothetical protein
MHTISPDDVVIIGGGPHPTGHTSTSVPHVMVDGHVLPSTEAVTLLRSIADKLDPKT